MLKIPNPSKYLTSKYPFKTWWEFLNVGALGIGSAFFASILFVYNWGESPLLWRVFTPKAITWGPGNHHALIMVLFGSIFFLTAYLRVNPLMTTLGVYFFVESYEGLWYVTYIASRLVWGGLFQWSWMTIGILCIPAIVGYVYVFGVPWKFLGWMVPMFVIWFAMGFPITNDFPAITIFYNNLAVNAWEIWTHAWEGLGFFLFVYPRLRKASDKITMRWSTDFDPLVNFIRRIF